MINKISKIFVAVHIGLIGYAFLRKLREKSIKFFM